jgi:cysteine-rich repeat protein
MIAKLGLYAASLLVCGVVVGCATGTPDNPGTGGSTSTITQQTGGAGGTGGTGGMGPAVCGDGTVQDGEDCDDGNKFPGDGCSPKCETETGYACSGQPSICSTTCGDGFLAGMEECDDQNTKSGDGCSADCKVETGFTCKGVPSKCETICGDGVVGGTEQCDDHNLGDGDGCDKSCQIEHGYACSGMPSDCHTVCGDGIIAGAEACDDGNAQNGDGCGAQCTLEPGYNCSGMPTVCTSVCGDGILATDEGCDDGNNASGDGCDAMCNKEPGWNCTGAPQVCTPICGDGKVLGGEQCDDGNVIPGDGCSAQCKVQFGYTCTGQPSVCKIVCGDGVVAGAEVCDDGNSTAGDGCSPQCKVEAGFSCSGIPSVCKPICGNGIKSGNETCDDNNNVPGDGCSPTCQVEPGWHCTGAPSACVTQCGDGVVAGTEECDDGNALSGDGCSALCTKEPGYTCTGTAPTVCVGICGDGVVVKGEQCDDSNMVAGDCCSPTCQAEAGCEIEINDTLAKANDISAIGVSGKVKGFISPTSDVDDYFVVIPTTASSGSLTATILDGPITGDTCASGKIDTLVTVYDQNGTALAANDDISTSNKCSTVSIPALPPGKYVVSVKNSPASLKTYSYTVQVTTTLAVCGNGVKEPGEQCDDGNTANGDGCSASCTIEGVPGEVEPNDTLAQADARAADPTPVIFNGAKLLSGSIGVAGDKDVFKVQLAAAGAVRFETFDNISPNSCTIAATRLRLFDSGGTQLYTDANSGISSCSALVVYLAAGTYYLQVEAATVGATIPGYFVEMSLPADGGAEVEPNNTQAQADPFPGTEMFVFGGHQTNTDSDFFAVTVPAGASLRAEVIEGSTAETCESLGVDSRLSLYNAGGTLLTEDDDNGRGYCSLIDGTGGTPVNAPAHALAAGTYYLQVRASAVAQSGAAGQFDYRLVVTIRP